MRQIWTNRKILRGSKGLITTRLTRLFLNRIVSTIAIRVRNTTGRLTKVNNRTRWTVDHRQLAQATLTRSTRCLSLFRVSKRTIRHLRLTNKHGRKRPFILCVRWVLARGTPLLGLIFRLQIGDVARSIARRIRTRSGRAGRGDQSRRRVKVHTRTISHVTNRETRKKRQRYRTRTRRKRRTLHGSEKKGLRNHRGGRHARTINRRILASGATIANARNLNNHSVLALFWGRSLTSRRANRTRPVRRNRRSRGARRIKTSNIRPDRDQLRDRYFR